MKDRIEKRIEQLEQQRDELKVSAMLTDREMQGQIQALRDVLAAIDADTPAEGVA